MLLENLPPCVPIPTQWYGKLDAYETLVLVGLLYHAGQQWDGQSQVAEVWESSPSISDLAQGTGLSRNTIRQALARLQSYGLVTVQSRRYQDGGHASNLYRVHLCWSIQREELA